MRLQADHSGKQADCIYRQSVYYYIVLCWALTGLHFAAAAAGEISPRLSKLAKPKKLRPKPFLSSAKLTEKK